MLYQQILFAFFGPERAAHMVASGLFTLDPADSDALRTLLSDNIRDYLFTCPCVAPSSCSSSRRVTSHRISHLFDLGQATSSFASVHRFIYADGYEQMQDCEFATVCSM